jgi:hypothetical protein
MAGSAGKACGGGLCIQARSSSSDAGDLRVNVRQPDKHGTYVLSLLQATLRFRSDCQRLIVEPGGYSNHIAAQRRFYRKAGFVKKPKADNVYVWAAK